MTAVLAVCRYLPSVTDLPAHLQLMWLRPSLLSLQCRCVPAAELSDRQMKGRGYENGARNTSAVASRIQAFSYMMRVQ